MSYLMSYLFYICDFVFQTDSVKYFFENVTRISLPVSLSSVLDMSLIRHHALYFQDYVPTNHDILLCRKATRSMSEHLFYIQKVPFM